MSELHKGQTDIGLHVESKEGERGPLCSNKANVRSPSLNLHERALAKETVIFLTELAMIARKIYLRLAAEGQTFDLANEFDDHKNGHRNK